MVIGLIIHKRISTTYVSIVSNHSNNSWINSHKPQQKIFYTSIKNHIETCNLYRPKRSMYYSLQVFKLPVKIGHIICDLSNTDRFKTTNSKQQYNFYSRYSCQLLSLLTLLLYILYILYTSFCLGHVLPIYWTTHSMMIRRISDVMIMNNDKK